MSEDIKSIITQLSDFVKELTNAVNEANFILEKLKLIKTAIREKRFEEIIKKIKDLFELDEAEQQDIENFLNNNKNSDPQILINYISKILKRKLTKRIESWVQIITRIEEIIKNIGDPIDSIKKNPLGVFSLFKVASLIKNSKKLIESLKISMKKIDDFLGSEEKPDDKPPKQTSSTNKPETPVTTNSATTTGGKEFENTLAKLNTDPNNKKTSSRDKMFINLTFAITLQSENLIKTRKKEAIDTGFNEDEISQIIKEITENIQESFRLNFFKDK